MTNAIAATTVPATNAGQRGPDGPNRVRRTGPAAVPAPNAAYANPIAVARGIPSIGDGHPGQRERQDDRRRDRAEQAAGQEERPVRDEQPGQAGDDEHPQGPDLDLASAVRVADDAADEQHERPDDGRDQEKLLHVGTGADRFLHGHEARAEDARVQACGGERQRGDQQGPCVIGVPVEVADDLGDGGPLHPAMLQPGDLVMALDSAAGHGPVRPACR